MPPSKKRGILLCTLVVGRFVGPSVGRPKLVRVIAQQCLDLWSSNLTWRLGWSVHEAYEVIRLKVTVTLNLKSLSEWLPAPTLHGGWAWLVNGPYWCWGHLVKGQGHSDLEREKLVRMITHHCLHPWPSNLTWRLRWPVDDPYRFWGHWVKGQGNSDLEPEKACPNDNSTLRAPMTLKLNMEAGGVQ